MRPALERRGALLSRLHAEDTTCYRLLHGVAEGCPGVTVDRYGPVLLVQTWREPLEAGAAAEAARTASEWLGVPLVAAWRHRGPGAAPDDPTGSIRSAGRRTGPSLAEVEGREMGVRYDVRPYHRGPDPLLFLDLRCVRRRVLAASRDRTVLNLFAYTCGVGLCAALGGAREVWNIDFARGALEVGRENARRNGLDEASFLLVRGDVFPVLRQLAGLPVKGRAARRRSFPRLHPRRFDLVVLDPPRWAKSPFGAVDTVRDYESLFKPAVLATRPGGTVIATNHVPEVRLEGWLARLERCARKAERPVADVEVLRPEDDFPAFDARPPLKVAAVSLAS